MNKRNILYNGLDFYREKIHSEGPSAKGLKMNLESGFPCFHASAISGCAFATVFWWPATAEKCILTVKEGSKYDLWRKNTETKKRGRLVSGRASVKLNDYPYRRLWSEPLLFDKNILSELTVEYTNYRKRAHAGILTGIALIGIGILFLPLLLPAEQELWDSVVLGAGMVLAGAGSFLCIYQTGMVKSYRLLIRNTNQF